MPLDLSSIKDIDEASLGLSAWFKSQSIDPFEGVMIIEFFAARMVATNSKTREEADRKINLIAENIRLLIQYLPLDKA